MSSEPEKKSSQFWAKPAPITLLGVVVLGLVGSTLYDLLVKPGLTGFGRLILDVLTLGSQRVLDSSYASAALDPTPVTGLLLLQGALIATCIPGFLMVARRMANKEEERLEKKTKDLAEDKLAPALAEELARLKRKFARLRLVFWSVFSLWIIMALVSFAVHNQSILVWRLFNANMATISAVASPNEIAGFRAEFAQMRTKAAYLELTNKMSKFAADRRITLYVIETW